MHVHVHVDQLVNSFKFLSLSFFLSDAIHSGSNIPLKWIKKKAHSSMQAKETKAVERFLGLFVLVTSANSITASDLIQYIFI